VYGYRKRRKGDSRKRRIKRQSSPLYSFRMISSKLIRARKKL
jgi:hypothetical protein